MVNVTTRHDDLCEGTDCRCVIREIGWIAREARGLASLPVPAEGSPEWAYWQARWDAFTERKAAVMAYVEATRS